MPAGGIESRQESFGDMGGAIIVATFAILAILAILVLEFRTFHSTLMVASVIPLGLAGGILALLLLPIALQGSGLYSPLAWVIIGGLVSSTLLARIVTPVMYKVLAPVISPPSG